MPFKLKRRSTAVLIKEEPMPFKEQAHTRGAVPLPAKAENSASEESTSERERIAQLAYSYWQERGDSMGSPEEDWFRAEQYLQVQKLANQAGRETMSKSN